MKKQLVLALALAAGTVMTVVAQDKPQAPPPAAQPTAPSAARQVPLKVQLTLSRFVGEKKISSTQYMLGVLTNAQKTSLRMGVQVPVSIGKTDGGSTTIPQSSYTYRDVGTNIDCEAQDVGGGVFKLVLTIEDSAIHLDRAPDSPQERQMARDVPAFRSFRSSFATVLHDGQSMQYASATDPISGEIMKIDVLLTLAK